MIPDFIKPVIVPIHREGYPFIAIFAVIAILAGIFAGETAFWICLLLTAWCIYFFRNPERFTPTTPGLIISPADGMVQSVVRADPPAELKADGRPMVRISVFMNVFDVHVNRIPINGRIIRSDYRPGKFLNASLDKASVDNERQSVLMEAANGTPVAFVQIAGLVARRILCDLDDGQEVQAGERFGMIRFGSRVDVYVPEETPVLVSTGQRAVAGETVLADMTGEPTKGRRHAAKR